MIRYQPISSVLRRSTAPVVLALAFVLTFVLSFALPALAAGPLAGPATAAPTVAPPVAEPAGGRPAEEVARAREYFTDVELVDQSGATRRLYSDLMADRVVVIAAMFTTCEGVCPVTMANFKNLQQWLGPQLGKGVELVAITVDPEHDTPEQLSSYATAFGAQEGWSFLTGSAENVEAALRRLGLYTEVKEGHSPVFLVGNERTGLWKKAMGLAKGESLVGILDTVLRDRRPEGDGVGAGR